MSPMQEVKPASQNGEHKKFNAWQHPGPASYDFRSDTMTTPTVSMLEAIQNTTLLDDVMLEDPTTNSLESFIADLTGHEAGLLVMSGTMGNQISIRSHLTQPPHSVLCDFRSHVIKYEAGGISSLSGAMLIPVIPSNKYHLTLEDVETHAIISEDIHACPTRVISLENTLNGTIMPLSEIQRISAFARQHSIKLHLDGARIWEAATATSDTSSLNEYTQCFDSVSLCFSKGLGAPIGSVIVGSKAFIAHARRIRKMMGGGTRQAGLISAPAKVAVLETFGTGPKGEGGKLKATHENAKRVARMWEERGGKLSFPTETNMVWPDVKSAGVSGEMWDAAVEKVGVLKAWRERWVVHYQITDEAIAKLGEVMDLVLAGMEARNGALVDEKGKDGYLR